jgi:hypothetical protein
VAAQIHTPTQARALKLGKFHLGSTKLGRIRLKSREGRGAPTFADPSWRPMTRHNFFSRLPGPKAGPSSSMESMLWRSLLDAKAGERGERISRSGDGADTRRTGQPGRGMVSLLWTPSLAVTEIRHPRRRPYVGSGAPRRRKTMGIATPRGGGGGVRVGASGAMGTRWG